MEWVRVSEKVDDPAGNTIYDEMRLNFLPAIEAEARAALLAELEREVEGLPGFTDPIGYGDGFEAMRAAVLAILRRSPMSDETTPQSARNEPTAPERNGERGNP